MAIQVSDEKLKKAANLGVALVDETTFLKSLNMCLVSQRC
mgnify:CR=1 FL=1